MAALCEPFEFDEDPTALYRLYDAASVLIYVGITSRPAARMRRHAKTQPWWGRGRAQGDGLVHKSH